jgi:hypothetical protein
MANDGQPLLISGRSRKGICFNSTDFDATGSRTAGGVGCAACQHQNLILIPIQETTVL